MTDNLYTGAAGRRRFVRVVDDGAIIVYDYSKDGARQQAFCSRAEWDEWCGLHAPLLAVPGLDVASDIQQVVVVDVQVDGALVWVLHTRKRLLSQQDADRLVQRVSRESVRHRKRAELVQEQVQQDAQPPETLACGKGSSISG